MYKIDVEKNLNFRAKNNNLDKLHILKWKTNFFQTLNPI